MPTITKDPNAVLDYTLDWSDWLETDTIAASTWVVDAGLTKDSDSFTPTTTTVWLSGGTAGRVYEALNRIVTAGGRTADRVLIFRMLDEVAYFCEIYDVADLLQVEIETAAQIRSAQRAVAEATEAIRNYCQQVISLVVNDEITLDVGAGQDVLFLPELPVIEVSEVIEDGDTLTAGSDEDYQLGRYGVLHRIGQNWAEGVQTVTVTYTHGYATIPQDVRDVATRAASRVYQAGLKSAELEGIAGVQAMSLGDYSVTFGSEGGGGVSEGVLGASAARTLLLSEKDTLNRYRLLGL
jgi:hypothetical protein